MKKTLSVLILLTMMISASGCSSAKQVENVTTESVEDSDGAEAGQGQAVPEAAQEELAVGDSTAKSSLNDVMLTNSVVISDELDKAIAEAVLSYNDGSYLEGECSGEGHIVMDLDEGKTSVTVYALTMYGEYGFENDMFIKISGTGVIPAVMTFTVGKDETYTLQSYTEPLDASAYTQSIKELFPKELYNRIIPTSESDKQALQTQERKYAKEYLDSIGRAARVGDYSDMEIELPDIPDETYDMIFERYWEYPYWIGTQERVENGVRYVYETQWKNYGNNDSLIYLTKYVYDTGEIIRTVNVHIDDGEVQSSEEKVLKIVENAK